jgi:hypothetical protein
MTQAYSTDAGRATGASTTLEQPLVQFRDRIVELRRVPAGDLLPNPRNWRTHPPAQRNALRGMLAEIGYAAALVARELPDGSLELIDGHLRAETTPDAVVPVVVLDVDEREAAKLLATLDPLAALAGANAEALASLVADVETDNQAVRTMLDELLARRAHSEPAAGPAGELSIGATYQVVADCRDEAQQRELYERLVGEGFKCKVLTL